MRRLPFTPPLYTNQRVQRLRRAHQVKLVGAGKRNTNEPAPASHLAQRRAEVTERRGKVKDAARIPGNEPRGLRRCARSRSTPRNYPYYSQFRFHAFWRCRDVTAPHTRVYIHICIYRALSPLGARVRDAHSSSRHRMDSRVRAAPPRRPRAPGSVHRGAMAARQLLRSQHVHDVSSAPAPWRLFFFFAASRVMVYGANPRESYLFS